MNTDENKSTPLQAYYPPSPSPRPRLYSNENVNIKEIEEKLIERKENNKTTH